MGAKTLHIFPYICLTDNSLKLFQHKYLYLHGYYKLAKFNRNCKSHFSEKYSFVWSRVGCKLLFEFHYYYELLVHKTVFGSSLPLQTRITFEWPSPWSSGQSSWLQIQRSRVRFPALQDFLRSSGSGTESTQPREDNWGATSMKK
jgi:hypothetical protein